tara:strand:+ start:306 stop:458 length:153 start_codon:yes stop_codon:yes gene_type:complete
MKGSFKLKSGNNPEKKGFFGTLAEKFLSTPKVRKKLGWTKKDVTGKAKKS